MPNNRFNAIQQAINRSIPKVQEVIPKVSDYFASNVFTIDTMRKYLSKEALKSVLSSIESGTKIEREIASQVAAAMKAWAISKGASTYCHWFHPLTGATAEKHETFFTPLDASKGIEQFSGNALVQQEPDGAAFPSGGLRMTFEARGYTAWDPSSPAFIMSFGATSKTLCIPTIFISYTGEALDYKAPLLKSQQVLEETALAIVHYFDRNVKKVSPTLGWEQEYFLVDAALYYARPDLVATGRTVLGASAAKGQQLGDHYFGSIPERIYSYISDFEIEALKLGIAISTHHNEVAHSQYECASFYSESNVSIDKNQLLMSLMKRVAQRHHLCVLFHEKPYAGVNGSGKHNNWSLMTDTGKNLLAIGNTARRNLIFLTFLINIIKAVSDYPDLLRASIASAGNEHRLGSNEAPPAIVSVFVGSPLTEVFNQLEQKVKKGGLDELEKQELKSGIHKLIPNLLVDNTDRNRTSPFAFTGNKFEIRGVGASANCAESILVLNTIVAQQLKVFKKEIEELLDKKEKKDGAILRVLRRYIKHNKNILFEGDNYGLNWEKEAKKRGLSNVKTTPHALQFMVNAKAKKLFKDNGIFTERELEARHEVLQEIYRKKIDIESKVLIEMVANQIVPAAIQYQNQLIENVLGLKNLGLPAPSYEAQLKLIKLVSKHINSLKINAEKLRELSKLANASPNVAARSLAFCETVKPMFVPIRAAADALELLVPDKLWTLPKYRELLFIQ